MMQMPAYAVSQWLNKLYVSILSPDRCRDAFKRTNRFTAPEFLNKVELLSDNADQLVFDASFSGDISDIKALLEKASSDVIDILIYRFNLRMAELQTQPGTLSFPSDKPDILAAFRLFLIVNEQIRNGPWPSH